MRTLVDIPADDLKALDELARDRNQSRAKVIRQALSEHLRRNASPRKKPDLSEFFGIWKGHRIDGLEYQQRLRAEWDR